MRECLILRQKITFFIFFLKKSCIIEKSRLFYKYKAKGTILSLFPVVRIVLFEIKIA